MAHICECGCGQETKLRKGKTAQRFLHGHNGCRNRTIFVNESDWTVTASGCWEWNHSLSCAGYAQVCINNRPVLVHRLNYERANGRIPNGLDLDHLCRNRKCVNPSHLEAVPRKTNLRRGSGAVLREELVRQIRDNVHYFPTKTSAARYYAAQIGCHFTTVVSAINGGTWN